MITAFLIGAGALWLLSRKNKGTAGIGDLTAWNKRHLTDFFERFMWGERVIVYVNYRDDRGYIPVDFIYSSHVGVGTSCVISPKNLGYLKDLCIMYRCEYKEVDWHPGYYPNVREISGIGATHKQPRRIWSEVELAQKRGIDLTNPDAWKTHTEILSIMAQGKIKDGASDKPIEQRYFNQLRRAYKSIAGTNLPYTENVVRNENDDVILIYRDYQLDKLPAKAADYMYDQAIENMHNDPETSAYWATVAQIANGYLKFVWGSTKDNVHRGAEKLVFGKSAPEERKRRISYLASQAKGGRYPEEYAHQLWERTGSDTDDQAITNGVLAAIREIDSKGTAADYCKQAYLQAFQVQEPLLYQDVPF